MGIQSNSWRVVNCLIILLTDSAVEMRVAGTVMDSVMTLLSLIKDNKVITESITVPATLISTAESVNKMIRQFTTLQEFDCIPNLPPPVSGAQKSAKRRATVNHHQSSPPVGTSPNVILGSSLYSPPRGRITPSPKSSSGRTQTR